MISLSPENAEIVRETIHECVHNEIPNKCFEQGCITHAPEVLERHLLRKILHRLEEKGVEWFNIMPMSIQDLAKAGFTWYGGGCVIPVLAFEEKRAQVRIISHEFRLPTSNAMDVIKEMVYMRDLVLATPNDLCGFAFEHVRDGWSTPIVASHPFADGKMLAVRGSAGQNGKEVTRMNPGSIVGHLDILAKKA